MEFKFPFGSRRTDPETSHQADFEHTASGKKMTRAMQVLWLLAKYPGSTSGELSRHWYAIAPHMSIRVAAETPHKRLSDLEDNRMVRKGEKRKCHDSGYGATTWHITNEGRKMVGLEPVEEQATLF